MTTEIRRRRSLRAAAATVATVLVAPLAASAETVTYQQHFGDAVTGNNQFTSGGNQYWFIDPGADNYFTETYERPTVQNFETVTSGPGPHAGSDAQPNTSYSAASFSDPSYYGYVDIVQGHFGFNSEFMYFGIELYSEQQVGSGTNQVASKFGEGTLYRIRLGGDDQGRGGILLSGEAAADYVKSEYDLFNSTKANVYLDVDRDVSGKDNPNTVVIEGGIANTDENTTGYENKIFDNNPILQTRLNTSADGRPLVEFKFNYVQFNSLYTNYQISPINPFLMFEATRGVKGESQYFWNDEWSSSEAGTPYNPSNEPQNIYELDTLRASYPVAGPTPVPLPAPAVAGLALFGVLGARRAIRARHSR